MAKQLAKQLGYIYVDSGAMYRTVSLYAMRKGFIDSGVVNKEALIDSLNAIHISFKYNSEKGYSDIYLNDENVSHSIRTIDVSNQVSKVAIIPEVRRKLVAIQKKIGQNKGVVMDGRDIGSVVFPDAELKLFITSSASTRAQRRYDELQEKGESVSYEEVLKNIQERDLIDTTREMSPLIKAEDAIEIDNSDMSIEEQFELILSLATKKIKASI
jgi:cytidylate kinase